MPRSKKRKVADDEYNQQYEYDPDVSEDWKPSKMKQHKTTITVRSPSKGHNYQTIDKEEVEEVFYTMHQLDSASTGAQEEGSELDDIDDEYFDTDTEIQPVVKGKKPKKPRTKKENTTENKPKKKKKHYKRSAEKIESDRLTHSLICDYCGASFENSKDPARAVYLHIRYSHILERKFPCEFPGCDKTFKRLREVEKHNVVHTKEKRYECPIEGCKQRFTQTGSMRVHVKLHEGTKPKLTCEVCQKVLTSKYAYNRHKMRLHDPNNPRTQRIKVPPRPGLAKSKLKPSDEEGESVLSKDKILICKICRKKEDSEDDMQQHFNVEHNCEEFQALVGYKCRICPYMFSSAITAYRHNKYHIMMQNRGNNKPNTSKKKLDKFIVVVKEVPNSENKQSDSLVSEDNNEKADESNSLETVEGCSTSRLANMLKRKDTITIDMTGDEDDSILGLGMDDENVPTTAGENDGNQDSSILKNILKENTETSDCEVIEVITTQDTKQDINKLFEEWTQEKSKGTHEDASLDFTEPVADETLNDDSVASASLSSPIKSSNTKSYNVVPSNLKTLSTATSTGSILRHQLKSNIAKPKVTPTTSKQSRETTKKMPKQSSKYSEASSEDSEFSDSDYIEEISLIDDDDEKIIIPENDSFIKILEHTSPNSNTAKPPLVDVLTADDPIFIEVDTSKKDGNQRKALTSSGTNRKTAPKNYGTASITIKVPIKSIQHQRRLQEKNKELCKMIRKFVKGAIESDSEDEQPPPPSRSSLRSSKVIKSIYISSTVDRKKTEADPGTTKTASLSQGQGSSRLETRQKSMFPLLTRIDHPNYVKSNT